jgi:peptide/nickel transport system permease protein
MSYSLRKVGKLASRILIVLLLGGFLGATLVRLAPGFGTDEEELDSRLSQASIESLRQSHLQNQNLALFYAHYLGQLAVGNLGTSQTLHLPVRQLLAERFPETLKTVGLGLCIGWISGFSLAIAAVMSRSWLVDLSASLLSSVLICIPAAVLALLFVIVQAPGRLVVGLIVFPKIFNYARNLLAQSASLPHVLTARAKGVRNVRLLVWHILPVAAPQLFALAGISVSISFAATIPVEVLCDLPGIGQLAWKAALGRDLELLVDLTMIVTLITLLANAAAEMAAHPLQRGEI